MNIKVGRVVEVTREYRQTPCQYSACGLVEPWGDQAHPWVMADQIHMVNFGSDRYGQLYWCSWDHMSRWAAEQGGQ